MGYELNELKDDAKVIKAISKEIKSAYTKGLNYAWEGLEKAEEYLNKSLELAEMPFTDALTQMFCDTIDKAGKKITGQIEGKRDEIITDKEVEAVNLFMENFRTWGNDYYNLIKTEDKPIEMCVSPDAHKKFAKAEETLNKLTSCTKKNQRSFS